MIKEEGNTKAAMGKMNQLDSFLKEAQRLYGDIGVCESSLLGTFISIFVLIIEQVAMRRAARKDFVFSDGTVVPAGSQIAVASLCTHLDEVRASFVAMTVFLICFPT